MKKYGVGAIFILCVAGVVFFALFFSAPSSFPVSESTRTYPTPVALEEKEVSMVFVGDIMLSRLVGKRIEQHADPLFPFKNAVAFLSSPDITFGNLESQISDRGKDMGSLYSFRARPQVVEGLSGAGFDVLSAANNHSWDWGADAMHDTRVLLAQRDIISVGTGDTASEAFGGEIIEKNGIRFIFFARTNLYPNALYATDKKPGVGKLDVEDLLSRIKKAKSEDEVDIVAISVHWGNEYETHAGVSQKNIAHALIDGGADIIIGHHPHVPQEVEWYKGKLIMYSLGNFVFDQNFSEETMSGLVVRVRVSKGGNMSAEYFKSVLNKDLQIVDIATTTPMLLP